MIEPNVEVVPNHLLSFDELEIEWLILVYLDDIELRDQILDHLKNGERNPVKLVLELIHFK